MIGIKIRKRLNGEEMLMCRINIGPERPEVGDNNLDEPTWFEDAINLLHYTNHIIQMLQRIVEINFIKGGIFQRIRKVIQIMYDVGRRAAVKINTDRPSPFLVPAPEVEYFW